MHAVFIDCCNFRILLNSQEVMELMATPLRFDSVRFEKIYNPEYFTWNPPMTILELYVLGTVAGGVGTGKAKNFAVPAQSL